MTAAENDATPAAADSQDAGRRRSRKETAKPSKPAATYPVGRYLAEPRLAGAEPAAVAGALHGLSSDTELTRDQVAKHVKEFLGRAINQEGKD